MPSEQLPLTARFVRDIGFPAALVFVLVWFGVTRFDAVLERLALEHDLDRQELELQRQEIEADRAAYQAILEGQAEVLESFTTAVDRIIRAVDERSGD